MKSDKMPYTIYASLESLLVKIDGCKNNSENNLKQKQMNIFLAGIHSLQYGHLTECKINITCTDMTTI